MTVPRMTVAATSPVVATTLGAKPTVKSTTPTTRSHHGHRGALRSTVSRRREASGSVRPCSTSETRASSLHDLVQS